MTQHVVVARVLALELEPAVGNPDERVEPEQRERELSEELREGIEAIRSYWRGEGGTFRESEIPSTGIVRRGCPILIAADAPRLTALAFEVGDGLLYGPRHGSENPALRKAKSVAKCAGAFPERT